MGKNILAGVVGFVALFAAVFVLYSIAFVIIGDGSYRDETFNVSMVWIITGLVLAFPAAYIGGWVARKVGRSDTAVKIALGTAIVFGLASALGQIMEPGVAGVRPDGLGTMEAMMSSIQPLWVGFVTIAIWAAGIWVGGKSREAT